MKQETIDEMALRLGFTIVQQGNEPQTYRRGTRLIRCKRGQWSAGTIQEAVAGISLVLGEDRYATLEESLTKESQQ